MNEIESTQGTIFNIQHYSIHDGPGIRTTVFLKGCPLRCFWCQNPESQAARPQLFFNADRCQGCSLCVQACPEGAIEIVGDRSRTNRNLCRGSGRCVQVCPHEARSLMGRTVTAGEVFEQVAADEVFYRGSGGGVTISGGEPLFQPEFTISLLKLCREAGIHTALDTSGYARWETMKRVLAHVDLVLYDLKHMDPDAHRRYTAVSNELILENAKKIGRELSIPILARLPLVPGYNDSAENVAATARFVVSALGLSTVVHLLPYHRLGEAKYDRLERPGEAIKLTPPDEAQVSKLRALVASYGLVAHAGG